jgi:hypothetical protein
MNNSLPVGATFFVLNSQMSIVNRSFSYHLGTAAGDWVRTIFAEGNGSYQRDDAYGVFTADYNWKMYFDPTTGYVVGYVYTEHDSDGSGDGFEYSDTLGVARTSYALTPDSQPPPPGNGSSTNGSGDTTLILVVVIVVIVVLVIAIVAWAVSRRRRGPSLPRHSSTGQMTYVPPPVGPAPPPIRLTPSGEPMVQQIVVKETVKVNCRYCGALIDSTAEKCPFCGAART